MKRLVVIVVLQMTACGSDARHGGNGDNPGPAATGSVPFSMAVTDDSALPPCNGDGKDRLVFVKASNVFKTCDGSNWSAIDIKGKDGAAGKDGVSGKDGAAGKDGTDNHIAASISCTGALQNTALFFSYSVSLMASGDIFAYGGIRSNALQIGAPVFYSSKQVGAATAAVTFTDDFEGTPIASYWDISLNRDTLVTTINYHAATVTSWTMTADKCVKNAF